MIMELPPILNRSKLSETVGAGFGSFRSNAIQLEPTINRCHNETNIVKEGSIGDSLTNQSMTIAVNDFANKIMIATFGGSKKVILVLGDKTREMNINYSRFGVGRDFVIKEALEFALIFGASFVAITVMQIKSRRSNAGSSVNFFSFNINASLGDLCTESIIDKLTASAEGLMLGVLRTGGKPRKTERTRCRTWRWAF